MKKFPCYKSVEEIKCFNCLDTLFFPEDKGYPDGQGRYRCYCEQCGYYTYFDLKLERGSE